MSVLIQEMQRREKSANEKIENLKYISVNLKAKLCKRECQIDGQKCGKNMEPQGHGGCDGHDAMAMKTTLTTNAVTTTDKQGHLKQGQRCECPADLTTAEHLKRYYQSIILSQAFFLTFSKKLKPKKTQGPTKLKEISAQNSTKR